MTTGPTTGAGWYPDPTTPGQIRYWDGRVWTEHSLQAPPMHAQGWGAPTQTGSSPRAPRPWWRRWWAIVIAVVAVLMVMGALSPNSDSGTKNAVATTPPTQTAGTTAQKMRLQRATVPEITGLSLAQAREQLRAQHLRSGYIERRPSAAQPGTVLSQGLHRGKQVAWRSQVPLAIAVAFPRLPATRGRSAAEASAALRSAGYRVRIVQKTVTSGTSGVVLSQTPLGGRPIRPNTLVTIVVAHVVRPLVTAPSPSSNYSPCLPPASDYDCGGGSGSGPRYVYVVEHVTGADIYDLDADGDGLGCE